MVNFIVCEDNKVILQKNVDIINKTMFENNIDYRIYPFSEYSDSFKNIIKTDIKNKIYILDIELDDVSGIDIARDIRCTDMESLIIISTTHTEYLPYTLKSKIMLFDYVSKFEDYEENLSSVIIRGLNSLSLNKCINFKSNNQDIKIPLIDILFIKYNVNKKCTVIKTVDGYYETNDSYELLINSLNDSFEKINQNYYENTSINEMPIFSQQTDKERSVRI